ncbi:MAG: leucine-rich repeat domain-containing protein [Anaeroplasmataceae bacterium]|nr:leucine-rich repeat domain-containing protein [Anaeroplasmataceae bacterium]
MKRKNLYIIIGSIAAVLVCLAVVLPVTLHFSNKPSSDNPQIPTKLSAGLYDEENQLTTSWDELVENQTVRLTDTTFEYCARDMKGTLVVDEGVTKLGRNAFLSCQSLTTVVLPASLTEIGLHAFYNCISLEEVSLTTGSQLKTIGYGAFTYCHKLKTFEIPSSVTLIDESAFLGCTVLDNITLPESISTIKHSLFKDCLGLENLTFTTSPTAIEAYAFYNCESLTSVDLTAIETIDEWAFFGCDSLHSITIPISCKAIKKEAFKRCMGLEEVLFEENDIEADQPLGSILVGEGVFQECTVLKTITLPRSLFMISDYMFSGCESLETFEIGKYITRIGRFAFHGCKNLKVTFSTKGYWVYSAKNDFTDSSLYTPIQFWSSEEDRSLLTDGLENMYFGIVEEPKGEIAA